MARLHALRRSPVPTASTAVLVAALAACALAHAQTAPPVQADTDDKPHFEVASIRQNKSNLPSHSIPPLGNGYGASAPTQPEPTLLSGGIFSAANQTLFTYIAFAYRLTGTQVLALRFREFAHGAREMPSWVTSDGFNIEARAEGSPTRDRTRLMLQTLLEDRFKLALHHETRQLPVLALILNKPGRTGPTLRPHPADDPSCSHPAALAPPALPSTLPCGVIARLPATAPGSFSIGGRAIPLALLASSFPYETGMALLSRPVIDRTGLTGAFDLRLEWVPEPSAPSGEPSPDTSGPSFFTALTEQLGLKLIPQTGPVDIIVLDHVARPTEN